MEGHAASRGVTVSLRPICGIAALFPVVALLSACGGGSGGDAAPNTPPLAVATATPPEGVGPLTVQFDAPASTDAGGQSSVTARTSVTTRRLLPASARPTNFNPPEFTT